jgi:hypothetical protein
MKNLFFCILLISIRVFCFSQDTHYWTNQYGPIGSILGNSIMGGIKDNSAMFYNPGNISFVDSNNVSASASIYQYNMLNMKEGAGRNLDLKSNQMQTLPSFVSGLFSIKKKPEIKYGYLILSKNQTGIKTTSRIDTTLDIIKNYNNPGKEEYIGQFSLRSSLNEQWFGASLSYKFSNHIALGITPFVAYRNQNLEYSNSSKVLLPTFSEYSLFISQFVSYSDFQSVEMSTLRGLGKIGLAFTFKQVDFGFTYTTKSIQLYSNSTVQRDALISNLNLDGNNFSDYVENVETYEDYIIAADSFWFGLYTFTFNDRQSSSTDKIITTYKSPSSFAAGIVFKSKALDEKDKPKSKISISFEYFSAIKKYYLIEPEDRNVLRPLKDNFNLSSIDFMGIQEDIIPVINYGIGIEQRLTKRINILASYRTNNSYFDYKNSTSGMAISNTFWNLQHYAIGIIYKKKKSDVSIGFTYSTGKGDMNPFVVMSDPYEENFLQGDSYVTNAKYNSIAFSIGYTLYFKCGDD